MHKFHSFTTALVTVIALLMLIAFAFALPSGQIRDDAQEQYSESIPDDEYDFL